MSDTRKTGALDVEEGRRAEAPTGAGRKKRPATEKRFTVLHFLDPLLRFLQLASSVAAFGIMTSLKPSNGGIKYSNYYAFSFLVAGTVISAAIALLFLLIDLILCCTRRVVRALPWRWIVVILDFIGLFMALGAGSAAAGITTFNDFGLHNVYVRTACQGSTPFNSFCARTKAATAMAIISSAFFLPSMFYDLAQLVDAYYE